MKVTMVSKAPSAQRWLKDWGGSVVEVITEKTITLPEDEFRIFSNDLLDEYPFITESKDLMRVDENGVWHCIKVECATMPYCIFVNAEGCDYARYTGIFVEVGR